MANEKKYETAYYDADEVRRQAAARKKKQGKYRRYRVALYIAGVVIVSALLAGIGWLLANDLCALNKEFKEVEFTVAEDDSVADVARNLKEAGIINYKGFFKLVGSVMHAKDKIDPGTYTINTNMDYRCLIGQLHDYEADRIEQQGLVKVTIPEGFTVNQIIDLLAENGVATREALVDACANYEFKSYDFLSADQQGSINRMEGFLFPTTYSFDPNKSAVYAVDTMLTMFQNQFDADTMNDISATGYSLRQIITMASIIEKEGIGDATERKNIASVLYNRMRTKDRETYGYLQLDTTIYYALSLEGKDKTAFNKDEDGPYNTYTRQGLPAGPICCPGMASIYAAVYPNDTNYYYFAAGKDGVNHFNETYNAHINFVNSDMYQPD